MSKITRKEIIKDFLEINEIFKQEFPNEVINRKYYTSHSKYGWKFETLFKDFTELKQLALKDSIQVLDKDKKIFKLTKEISDLKEQKDYLLKEHLLEELVLDTFNKNLESFDFDKIKIDNSIDKKIYTDKIAVMNLNDWHVGEVVDGTEVLGINTFNKDIFVERADRIFNRFLTYCEKIGITEINLNFLGDLLSGMIQDESNETADLNIVESMFFVYSYIMNKLAWLSEHVNKIKINFLVGNHGRILKKNAKPFYKKKAILNWEYVLGRQIESTLKLIASEDKISINVPKSPFIVDEVNGTKFLLMHGDILSKGGSKSFAGLPFYGFTMNAAKFWGLLSHVGTNFESTFKNVICGHYHTSDATPIFTGGKLWVSACLCGETEFSLYEVKMKSFIEQLLLVVDNRGHIDGEINIRGLE